MKGQSVTKNWKVAGTAAMTLIAGLAVGAEQTNPADLEEVTVYAARIGGTFLGGDTVTRSEVAMFGRETLDEALLLTPGASLSAVGARNETNISIRGFDRWRVTLYQDGIPIYLPVDNRIDYGRFTTADLAEIQVSKGFASVIDGPGAMGGSINLVSRVVAKPFEFDARVGTLLDSHETYAGWNTDVFTGGRFRNWFVQGAGTFSSESHFRLSDDFAAATLQGPGNRIESAHQDYKINVKGGYSEPDGAEYAVNVIDQVGRKDNPPPDSVIPAAALKSVKYWTWPSWDKKSFYWLSKNPIDDRGSYVKTRFYYDKFFNQLDSFDTIAYSIQTLPKSFDSTYDDRAAGGSIELSETLPGGADTIRVAGHYRWDQHNETESTTNVPGGTWYQQPWESASEMTSSIALENIFRPSSQWDVIVGTSYDLRHLNHDNQWVAQGAVPPFGYTFSYPVADKHALNGEFALVYRYSGTGSVSFSYADRARFPTLFEMYSTRFGTFINNPDLQPERSHYGQVTIADTWAGTHVVVDAFYARINDIITAVAISPTVSENENTGTENRQGFEIEVSRPLLATLSAGVNYSNLDRNVRAGGFVATDTPDHMIFAFLDWKPVSVLEIVPSLDVEGRRWLQSATNNLVYYRGGNFTTVGLKVAYQPTKELRADVGVRNLTDRNYVVEDGYHAPGREYYASVRFTF